jgi:hypothetical protein
MYRLSFTKGARSFINDRKDVIKMLTIALLAAGAASALLFAYQQFTKAVLPDLISREEAVQIALKAGKWNEQNGRGMEIDATLIHVQPNGFALKVDDTTLQDIPEGAGRFEGYENQYVWLVDVFASNSAVVNRGTNSWIDAGTGDILSQYP